MAGWMPGNQCHDQDEQRRLYYVAMTRAQQTLTLARFDSGHVLLDQLPSVMSLLRRTRTEFPSPLPDLGRRYQRLKLQDVDLGFAGRYAPTHPVHHAIGRTENRRFPQTAARR